LLLCAAAWPAPLAASPDGSPAGTLLLPYFFVSRNGIQPPAQIPAGGTDTLFRVVNTGETGLVVRIGVFSKYGRPGFGVNVPMAAHDVVTGSVRDLLNGKFNVNPLTQAGSISSDPCGLNQTSNVYSPSTGFGTFTFVRFANPDAPDAHAAISRYAMPAILTPQRTTILDSLDESKTLSSFGYPLESGVLDGDNPQAGVAADGVLSGDFSGYVTFDVVNYCTEWNPYDAQWWENDAIATAGWSGSGFTPNALVGGYKYDGAGCGFGADFLPMPGLPFDAALAAWAAQQTFYGRFHSVLTDTGTNPAVPAAYRFVGDGRKPLGTSFAVPYVSGVGGGFHLTIFRTDVVANPLVPTDVDVADWYANGGPERSGFADGTHQLHVFTWDKDTGGGEVSGPLYAFLQTQRYAFPPAALDPGAYAAGWMSLSVPGGFEGQAFVAVDRTVCSGDPNGDGIVDVADVFYLINFLFAGGTPPK
jgi:hypothetical protein